MFRGTTPTHKFNVNVNLQATRVFLTYKQRGSIVVEKDSNVDTETLTIDGNSVTVTLSQEDTLKFNYNEGVEIQIRAVYEDGKAIASSIITTYVDKILKDGEIAYADA